MFGDCEAAKPEHGGRTEQRSASDLSTQTTARLLSIKLQTDKDLCSYMTGNKVFPSFWNKNISQSVISPKNLLNPDMKTFRIPCQIAAKPTEAGFGVLLPWRQNTDPNKGSKVALLWNVYQRRRGQGYHTVYVLNLTDSPGLCLVQWGALSMSCWWEHSALRVTDMLFPTVTFRGRWSGVSSLHPPLWLGTSSAATEL